MLALRGGDLPLRGQVSGVVYAKSHSELRACLRAGPRWFRDAIGGPVTRWRCDSREIRALVRRQRVCGHRR